MKNLLLNFLTLLLLSVLTFSCQKQIDYQPQINELKTGINNLQKSRDSLASVLSNINTTNSAIIKSLDSLKIQISFISTQIITLNTQMLSANANIASLTLQISDLNKKYADLLEALNFAYEELGYEVSTDNIKLNLDLKQFFQYYKVLNANFLAQRIGMNPTLLSQYVRGKKHPSAKQTDKIIKGIQTIGKELSEISLV